MAEISLNELKTLVVENCVLKIKPEEIGEFRRQFRDDELGQVRLTRAVEVWHSRLPEKPLGPSGAVFKRGAEDARITLTPYKFPVHWRCFRKKSL